MAIRDEFKITRSGKLYVLFAGLLEEAHERGLRGIDTKLVQVPTKENGQVAIAKAVVDMGEGRTFSGIGDASPDNVSRNIAPHIIRQSETRAKARALRDAINVGTTALEELSDGDEAPTPREARTEHSRASEEQQERQPASVGAGSRGEDLPASRKQRNYLEALVEEGDEGRAGFEERIGRNIEELTRAEASEWIGRLSGRAS